MQLGVTTCSHHCLWTWSRLEFCGDDLEETVESVTWGPHSTRSNFRIDIQEECLWFVGMERNGMLSVIVRVMESRVNHR